MMAGSPYRSVSRASAGISGCKETIKVVPQVVGSSWTVLDSKRMWPPFFSKLKIFNYSPAIQYLEAVAWASRMKLSFDDLSKLGVTAIERIDFAGPNAGHTYILDAGGPRLLDQDFNKFSEVGWARDPAKRGRIYQGPVALQQQGDHRIPFFTLATPVYEVSLDESHPKATGNLDGVMLNNG